MTGPLAVVSFLRRTLSSMPSRSKPSPPTKAAKASASSTPVADAVVVLTTGVPAAISSKAAAKARGNGAAKASKIAKAVIVVKSDEHDERDEDEDERDEDADEEADPADTELVEGEGAAALAEDDENIGKVEWEDDDEAGSGRGRGRERDRNDRTSDAAPPSTALAAPASSSGVSRMDPLAVYMREVHRHPVLSPEEQQGLARTFLETQNPELAAKLVTTNLRLVVKIAYEYRRACKNIMDLVQEGNIGLLQAVKRYDPYRGVRLSSYAAWWIRAYMLRYVLNNFRLVKLGTTQNQRRLFFNLNKARAKLSAMGIDATDEAIAKQLDVTPDDVREMTVRLGSSEASLDAPVGNGDGDGKSLARVDALPSLDTPADESLAHLEMLSLMREHLVDFRETLPVASKELVIFDKRLVSDEPLTLQEIGDSYGISRERVRQLEQRVTTKLRAYLIERVGEVVDPRP